jgi:hypothetical protein
MTSRAICTSVTGASSPRLSRPARPAGRQALAWAWVAIAAPVLFVGSWLAAASWQGPRYSVLAHSISDMYAVTAPHGSFLVVVFTDCGAATILFALLSVWPMLRSGGRAATAGSALLGLSAAGLGDVLSPVTGAAAIAALAVGILRRSRT